MGSNRQSSKRLSPNTDSSLQTCVIRAWDRRKPLLFCPAMNTAMWEHPITSQQVDQLKAFGYTEIPCVVKKLVCGDQGGHLVRFTVCSHCPGSDLCSAPSLL